MKIKKLICVEIDNKNTGVGQSNKFYDMTELGDGTFKVEYGRVGKTKMEMTYPMKDWNKILKSKLKKYEDVTHLRLDDEVDDNSTQLMTGNIEIDGLINELQVFAGAAVKQNYKISSKQVTEAMVNQAQKILDELVPLLKLQYSPKEINDRLLQLYKIIPREMYNVKQYLINKLETSEDLKKAQRLIGNEQDTLDTMAGQVKLLQQQLKIGTPAQHISLLERMGIQIEIASSEEFKDLKEILKTDGSRLKKAYKVVNFSTQENFDRNLQIQKQKNVDLFFHGSRNQNWFNIIQTGLLIRPAGAIHTGSMFGDGIYGANKAKKAIGYSSLQGSYWTNGSDKKGFLGVFQFHVGNQKHIKNHDSGCYSLNKRKLEQEGFDSVYAHGGIDLKNDEFIVYDSSQCTIKYLLELS